MPITPLDQHREANTSSRAAPQILSTITDRGVEYLYYQAVTITGRVVGKVVPAHHLARNAERGIQLHRTAVSDLQTDRAGNLLGGGAEAAEFTALPDLDTFAVLPWDSTTGRFFCRLYEPDHRPEVAAGRSRTDVRGICCGCTPASPPAPVWSCAAAASPR